MDPGRLSREISLERNTPVEDAGGQPVDSWAEVAKLWASDPVLSTAPIVSSDHETARTRLGYLIRAEAAADIDPDTDRIVDGSLTLKVVEVLPKDSAFSELVVEGQG